MRCRTVFSASQPGLASRTIPRMASSLAPIAGPMSQFFPNELSDDEYSFSDNWIPEEDNSFAAQPLGGEFTTIVLAVH